jgi:RNA polymerase sigma-70 factor, ECF subfamily
MNDSILQRVASGNPDAMRACIDQFGGLVWSLARRLARADAEDAMQEIFLDLWKSAARFDPSVASEATFVAMIARRRLIDRMRRPENRTKPLALPEGEIEALRSRDPGPDVSDEAARARRALETLTPDQQRVLRLAVDRGLSHEEIARATDLPPGTVKTHIRRGLIRVRELLESAQPTGGRVMP